MPISKTQIGYIQDKSKYKHYPYGSKAGQPTVELRLSSDERNLVEVSAIDKMFSNYRWSNKLRSGFARLRITGTDPLADRNITGIDDLTNIINPRFVDIEIAGEYLDKKPARTIKNTADSYSLFITSEAKYNNDVLDFFADRSRKFGDAEFIFKVTKWTDEDFINSVSNDYKIYDSDIWLYPGGRKISTMAENLEICEGVGKRNTWNISPRFDLFDTDTPEDDLPGDDEDDDPGE